MIMSSESLEKKLEKWRKLEEEAREIRRREANWDFVEKQPPRLKAALKYYIEFGDIRTAAKIAGLAIDEFRMLLLSAGIPTVV